MRFPGLKRTFCADASVSALENNVASVLVPILGDPFLGGGLVSGVALTSGVDNVINHGLGKSLQGWLLTDNTTSCTVWRTAWDSKTLTLRTSASTTVNVRVF